MLKIAVKLSDDWDEEKQEFISNEFELELEHSLVSLSKWESEFEKPFLGKEEKSNEEVLGYLRCMTLTPDVSQDVYDKLSPENFEEINRYIERKMTGTTIHTFQKQQQQSKETISAELIYYWLVSYQIPWEAQYWHLNRLLTLIQVFNTKNADPKKNKMSKAEMLAHRRQLNEQRRREMGTSG